VQASGLIGVTAIAAGWYHTVALKNDGTVWAWGYNVFRQLGDGTTTDRTTPVPVNGLSDVRAIAAGGNHTLALRSDGTVWAWGLNGNGQLGDGSPGLRTTLVQVGGLSGVTAIAAGGYHSLALKSDGTVGAWGLNLDGQLGDGTTTDHYTPVQVSGLSGVTAIATSLNHNLALQSDGSVRAWGYNQFGQLGDGTTAQRSAPVQVSGLSDVTAIAVGHYHSLAVKSDGSVHAWGDNQLGQLGDGTQTTRVLPRPVTGMGGVSTLAAGVYHSMALKGDGTVWTWGYNGFGELGADPTQIRFRLLPGQVNGLLDVRTIAANLEQSFVLRAINTDTTAPTIVGSRAPAANSFGWNNSSVVAHFDCSDAESGIAGCPSDYTFLNEGAGQLYTGMAIDNAGNIATATVENVNIDMTAPTIVGAPTSGANGNGWFNGPVMIHWTCDDVGTVQSGIASCPVDDTITSDGAGQSRGGTTTDRAGNSASQGVIGINIDSAAPVITLGGIMNGGIYTLGAVPPATCAAVDILSGLDGACSMSVTGGSVNGVGAFNFNATATDRAGNTATVTGTYRVIYRFDGFLQPINDTGHAQICGDGCVTSIFKGGSTVPVKFQLKQADGTLVQAGSPPQWLTPQKGGMTTAPIGEGLYSDPATTEATFRWDSTSQQYIYNWSTKGATVGYYYRISVILDDGQTYMVDVGLR
jgi:alpha-tubulin suppressor-like RCC1 family protein